MRMSMPDHSELVSVIMPAYNSERTIEAAVTSVIEQTCRNWELIIVDDASGDDTPDICRRLAAQDERILIITNSSNLGRVESRRLAVNASHGDLIAFLDSDDMWTPDKLSKQLALRDDTGCDLVYTGSSFIDENGRPFEWIMHVPERIQYRQLLRQNIISNSSVLVKKDLFLRFAPDSEDKHDMHEDFACWLGMLRAGINARGIDEPLITYRLSKSSMSGNKFKAYSMNMNTYKYVGLGFFSRLYYQMCYSVNGINKYRHLR